MWDCHLKESSTSPALEILIISKWGSTYNFKTKKKVLHCVRSSNYAIDVQRREILLKYFWLNQKVLLVGLFYSSWPKYLIILGIILSWGVMKGLLWGCCICSLFWVGRHMWQASRLVPPSLRGRAWAVCCQHPRPWWLRARWLPQCLTLKCQLQLKTFFQRTSLSILGPYGDQSLWACDRLGGQALEKSRWKEL